MDVVYSNFIDSDEREAQDVEQVVLWQDNKPWIVPKGKTITEEVCERANVTNVETHWDLKSL